MTRLPPLVKRALRARRMVMLNYRRPGVYVASIDESSGWRVATGRSAEDALDALEKKLEEDMTRTVPGVPNSTQHA